MSGKRILLVDDEAPVRETLKEMLDILEIGSDSAGSGFEALEMVQKSEEPYDCVLLDLYMPEMDGLETFDKLQSIDPSLRIYIVSGYGEGDVTDELLEKGASGILAKPFRIKELQEVIGSL